MIEVVHGTSQDSTESQMGSSLPLVIDGGWTNHSLSLSIDTYLKHFHYYCPPSFSPFSAAVSGAAPSFVEVVGEGLHSIHLVVHYIWLLLSSNSG